VKRASFPPGSTHKKETSNSTDERQIPAIVRLAQVAGFAGLYFALARFGNIAVVAEGNVSTVWPLQAA
jgi:hypothetical protein